MSAPSRNESKRVVLDVIAALRLLGDDWLRGSKGESAVELRGWVMEHVELPEVSFPYGTDMTRANLDHANLRGAVINHTLADQISLFQADLQAAAIEDSSVEVADLRLANLRLATLTNTRFRDSNMASIKGEFMNAYLASFERVNFEDADLSFAVLVESDLVGANFDGAILIGADLTGADIAGATFNGARMDYAILGGHDLDDLIARGAIGIDSASATDEYSWEDAGRIRDEIFARISPSPAGSRAVGNSGE